ncbi:MAG: ComEC/Rec2 family competence protein [Oscillospiraceae bacterium]|nr:ComEC/Rec2 family competence protein [Oscillospiraceae bacterium]
MKRPLFLMGICCFGMTLAAVRLGASVAFAMGVLCVFWAVLAAIIFGTEYAQGVIAVLISGAIACLLTVSFLCFGVSPNIIKEGMILPSEGTVLNVRRSEKSSVFETEIKSPLLPEALRVNVVLHKGADVECGWKFTGKLKVWKGVDTSEVLPARDIPICVVSGELEFDESKTDLNIYERMAVLRHKILDVCGTLGTQNETELLKGILLGETRGFSDEFSEQLSRSGLRHLTAVSGMHIGIITGFVFTLGRLLEIRARRTAVLVLMILPFMALLQGCTPSVLRACLMCAAAATAKIAGRQYDVLSALGLAAVVILAADPTAVLNVSYQLTFAAVIGICFLQRFITIGILELPFIRKYNEPNKRSGKMVISAAKALAVSIAAQIAVTPLLLYHFGSYAIFGFAATMLVIPVFPMIMIISGLAVALKMLFPAAAAGEAGYYLVKPLMWWFLTIVKLFAKLPEIQICPGQEWFFALLAVFYFTAWLIRKHRKLYIPALTAAVLVSIFANSVWQKSDRENLHIIMAGDDALLLRRGENAVLVGDLPNEYSAKNAVRILRRNGVDSLDGYVITAGIDDAGEGALALCQAIPTEQVFVPAKSSSAELLKQHLNDNLIEMKDPVMTVIDDEISAGIIFFKDSRCVVQINEQGKNILNSSHGYDIITTMQLLTDDNNEPYIINKDGERVQCRFLVSKVMDTVPHAVIKTGGNANAV